MSTTFGVKIPSSGEIIEIARRTGARTKSGVNITFINEIAELLPSDLEVIPLDNTAQRVYTVGDLKRLIYINKEG